MEADLRVMQDLKNQIEKARNNFKKSPKERITESYVTARLEGIEEIIKRFSNKHESIISSYEIEALDKSGYFKSDIFNLGYESYLVYKSELMTLLSSTTRSSTKLDTFSFNAAKDCLVRLPKISIPVFSGNYAEWSSFKDLFISLIHNNATLDDVQRLHYLKTQLKGEAEQLIKHISITQANYTKCWNLLQNRYNNKRFMTNCILKRLFSQRPMANERSNGLKDLLDTTSDCLHELSNLGIKVDSWDILIIYIVSLKLDAETRKQWELHVNSLGEELPTFTHLKEFLECRFRALEFVEPVKNKPKFTSSISKSLHAIPDVTCPHCAEHHRLFSCSKFIEEDVNGRQELVKSLGLCWNCLGPNHTEKTCRVPTTCRICNKRHHTLLHGKPPLYTLAIATETIETNQDDEQTQNSEVEINPTYEANHIASHFAKRQKHSQTLLPTALVNVESQTNHFHELRALLDQGSQASFISEATVQLLGLDKITEKSCVSSLSGGHSDIISKHVVMINMQSLHDPTFKLKLKAHVLHQITSVLPEHKFVLAHWADLNQVRLADPQYNVPNKIDILLGAEVYGSILKQGLIKQSKGSLIAQDTYLGWILSGQVDFDENGKHQCHNRIMNMHVTLESDRIKTEKDVSNAERQAGENKIAGASGDQSYSYVVEVPFHHDANSRIFGDKPRTTRTKLRTSKLSLNETIWPRIMRWHLHAIWLITYIFKIYKQMVRRDNSASEIKDHKLLRMSCVISCAHYLAVNTLKKIVTNEGWLTLDCYWDEFISSCQSETENCKHLKSIFKKRSFISQKRVRSRKELLGVLKENTLKDREGEENVTTKKIIKLTKNDRSDALDDTVKLLDESKT